VCCASITLCSQNISYRLGFSRYAKGWEIIDESLARESEAATHALSHDFQIVASMYADKRSSGACGRLEMRTTMDSKVRGAASILAAFLVLFTAMLDPRISSGLAVLLLVALSIYEFNQSRRRIR
jgi:hypothetical protein